MSTLLPAPCSVAYRSYIAALAQNGGAMSPITQIAFGTGSTPYSPEDDRALEAEVLRVPARISVEGPALLARGTLLGSTVVGIGITEAAAFTESGLLVARKTFPRIELEFYGEMEIDITFEY